MRAANGEKCPIESYGDLSLTSRSSSGVVSVLLRNVPHVPSLRYHRLSLRAIAEHGHTFLGDHEGITSHLSSGEILFLPSIGRLNVLYAYRPGTPVDEHANAVIPPTPTTSSYSVPAEG